MIKAIKVTNYLGDSIDLELANPDASGMVVANVEGLGAADATINTTELATSDGAIFSSSRVGTRNILMSLILQQNPDVETVRHLTYKYFPIKRRVSLQVTTDSRIVETVGYVESNSPTIFSKEEYTQISIVCPDPYFYEGSLSETSFLGVDPKFEFPFENPSATEDLIEFGEVRLDTRAVLVYEGDVETGIVITIHALNNANGIVLYNMETREKIKINTDKIESITGKPFGSGDDIIISTIRGQRYARLLRNGEYTNVISALGKDTDWFQLYNGDNVFAFSAEYGERELIVTFTYRNAYGGV